MSDHNYQNSVNVGAGSGPPPQDPQSHFGYGHVVGGQPPIGAFPGPAPQDPQSHFGYGHVVGGQPPIGAFQGQPPYTGTGSHGGSSHTTTSLGALTSPMRAVFAVLVALTLGLGVFAVVTHGNLNAAQTQETGLSDSLGKARQSTAAAQAELERTKKDAAASAESLKTMTACASALQDAWSAYFSKDYKAAQAALDAATEPCKKALNAGGSSTSQ